MFDAASRCPSVKRVVFSSTAFAHGWCHDPCQFIPKALPIDEQDEPSPHEAYGLSKQCGEAAAAMMARFARLPLSCLPLQTALQGCFS